MQRITLLDPNDYLDWQKGSGRSVEIYDIAVNSERGIGNGRRLVERLKREMPKDTALIFAITRISNTIAQQFYESLGFRIVGRLHNFYREEKSTNFESALMYGLDV